jgi:hypothetical protein
LAYKSQADKIMGAGTYAEKKRLIRSCVDKITIAPDTLEVEIQYKVPEAIGALSGSGGFHYSELYPDLVIENVKVARFRGKTKTHTGS